MALGQLDYLLYGQYLGVAFLSSQQYYITVNMGVSFAVPILLGSAGSIDAVRFHVYGNVDAKEADVSVTIHTDLGGQPDPGNALESVLLSSDNTLLVANTVYEVGPFSSALAANTHYWLVVKCNAPNGFHLGCGFTGLGLFESVGIASGTSWPLPYNNISYRLQGSSVYDKPLVSYSAPKIVTTSFPVRVDFTVPSRMKVSGVYLPLYSQVVGSPGPLRVRLTRGATVLVDSTPVPMCLFSNTVLLEPGETYSLHFRNDSTDPIMDYHGMAFIVIDPQTHSSTPFTAYVNDMPDESQPPTILFFVEREEGVSPGIVPGFFRGVIH